MFILILLANIILLLCGYMSYSYYQDYKKTKDNTDIVIGILYMSAMVYILVLLKFFVMVR
jgi:hypothetical protein